MGLDIIYITSFNGFRARMSLARFVSGVSSMGISVSRSHYVFSFRLIVNWSAGRVTLAAYRRILFVNVNRGRVRNMMFVIHNCVRSLLIYECCRNS